MRRLKLISVAAAALFLLFLSACGDGIPEENRNRAQEILELASSMEETTDEAKDGYALMYAVMDPIPANFRKHFSEFDRLLNEIENAWDKANPSRENIEQLLERDKKDDEIELLESALILIENLLIIDSKFNAYMLELKKMIQKLKSETESTEI